MGLAQPASAALTNRYVVKGNPGAGVPYDSLAKAAADIQAAIDYAKAGETVLVAAATYDVGGTKVAGRYLTNRVYISKAITVRSIDNDPAATLIKGAWDPAMTNGAGAVRCVYMAANSMLIGFTLTNGATLSTNERPRDSIGKDAQGGGVCAATASAVISNCVITGNTALGDDYNGLGGGGVAYATVLNSMISGNWVRYRGGAGAESALLSNCTVVGNSTPGNGGGALRGALWKCVVSNNTAGSGMNGGGISGWDAATRVSAYECAIVNNRAGLGGGGANWAVISNCTIACNVATNGSNGRGGGTVDSIVISSRVVSNTADWGGGTYGGNLTNCVVAYNVASIGGGANRPGTTYNCLFHGNQGYGGGMYLANGNTLDACTIIGNTGSGILLDGVQSNAVVNCIIYSNSNAGAIANWVKGNANGAFLFTNSCTTPAWSGWADGNITDNPRFVSFGSGCGTNLLAGNYRLSPDSPCINTGTNETWMTRAVDLDGRPRLDVESGLVDKGCYEYIDVTFDRYAAHNGQTPVFPYKSWSTAASNIQDAVNAAFANTTVWVGRGRYTVPTNAVTADGSANVVYIDKPLALRSSNGVPAETIIDGGGTNRGVMMNFSVTEPDTSTTYRLIIDGFTVSNSHARGAGISFNPGGTTWTGVVQNCIVSGNTTTNADCAGGLYAYSVSGAFGLVVSNSVIGNNTGGGLYSRTAQGGTAVTGCRVGNNAGTGIKLHGGSNVLRNCLIWNNYAGGSASAGGGMSIDACTPELYNCTVVSNSTAGAGIAGVYVHSDANVAAWNSIIVSNYAGSTLANGPPGDHGNGAGYFYLTNCCIDPTEGVIGTGNIADSPAFVDFAGQDFRLTEDSPCVDTGTNQVWMVGAVDLAGYSRVDYGAGMVDRGCYERLAYSRNLVRDGRPLADIVIATNPPRMVTLAANELQTYVSKITGVQLPIVTVPTPNGPAHIYVGESSNTVALGLSSTGLLHGAFRMVSGTHWLALLGHDSNYSPPEPYWGLHIPWQPYDYAAWDAATGQKWGDIHSGLGQHYSTAMGIWTFDERGSLNAVHEYLRNLGVRWYFPGPLGEVAPQMASIALTVTNETVQPDFALRNMCFYYHFFNNSTTDEIMWQLRLGLNWGADLIGVAPPNGGPAHGINNVHCRVEIKQAHPEYYALWGGVRQTNYYNNGPGAPCLSSDGLFTQNVAYVRAVHDIYNESLISVMPNDGYTTLCECNLCKGKDTPERGDAGNLSDYVWAYVNRVAQEIHTTRPDTKVSCAAYTAYQLPPTNINLFSSNVAVFIARHRQQNGFSYYSDPETRAYFRTLTTSWLEKLSSQTLYIYDYYLLHSGSLVGYYGVPILFPRLIAEDLRFQKGKSKGKFFEVARGSEANDLSLATYHLNIYVTARMLWDADQDIDELLDDYYQKFYGPAATEMKAFVEYSETNWPTMRQNNAVMGRMLTLLDAARQAAGTGVYSQRVDLINQYVQPIRILCQPGNYYAAHNGQTPVFPYTNWTTAASNIQDAVNAATTNDTVWIGAGHYTVPTNPGVYHGTNVVYVDKPLNLRSSNGVPASTVIDGGGVNRGVAMIHFVKTDRRFTLDGLTIANCYATNAGGGVLFYSDDRAWYGVVQNCIISNNTVAYGTNMGTWNVTGSRGGGICSRSPLMVDGASGLIVSNCVITGNRALDGGWGGGIFARAFGQRLVTDCLIEKNSASYGGGVAVEYTPSGQTPRSGIENCVIKGNRAVANASPSAVGRGGGWYGVAMTTGGAGHGFRNCLIANNTSADRGGGLFDSNAGKIEVINCTIVSNKSGASGWGSGIYVQSAAWQIGNSILYSNAYGDNLYMGTYTNTRFTNCCVTPTNSLLGSGNITNAPRFANFAGQDFRLATNSPCRDTGTNQAWMIGASDLAGLPRIINSRVDRGAYECLPPGPQFRVVSDYGLADLPPGLYTRTSGTTLTNTVSEVETHGTTQYACTGWTMTGNDPLSGPNTNMTLVLTNNAVLTWQWATNYWLATTNAGLGTVVPSSAWQALGSNVVLRGLPQTYHHFTQWTGAGTRFIAVGDAYASAVTVIVANAMALTGAFAETQVTNGVPEWWLAQYGLTNFNSDAMMDRDGDGMLTWQEWVAGCDPLNSNSVFRFTSTSGASGQGYVICWPSISNRFYGLARSTNLVQGTNGFLVLPGASNMPATPTENSYTDSVQGVGPYFYRIDVRK